MMVGIDSLNQYEYLITNIIYTKEPINEVESISRCSHQDKIALKHSVCINICRLHVDRRLESQQIS